MNRRSLLLWLAATPMLVRPALAGDSIRFGSRLVKKGDPVGRVIDVAGRPDYVSPIENEYGALLGERWEYYFDGYNARTVFIIIRNGRVVEVQIHHH